MLTKESADTFNKLQPHKHESFTNYYPYKKLVVEHGTKLIISDEKLMVITYLWKGENKICLLSYVVYVPISWWMFYIVLSASMTYLVVVRTIFEKWCCSLSYLIVVVVGGWFQREFLLESRKKERKSRILFPFFSALEHLEISLFGLIPIFSRKQ